MREGEPINEEKKCRECGAILKNDTYGDRCENCYNNRSAANNLGGTIGVDRKREIKNADGRRRNKTKGQG